jgi:hypothetical protein
MNRGAVRAAGTGPPSRIAIASVATIATTPSSCRTLGASPKMRFPSPTAATGCTVRSTDDTAGESRAIDAAISSQPIT